MVCVCKKKPKNHATSLLLRPQRPQKLQILRNSRAMRRTILEEPHHLLIPAFPSGR